MSLRVNAEYSAFIKFSRFQALNDDKTLPLASRQVGGAGPFDFSGVASPSAVEFTVKIDGTEESQDLDVDTGSVSLSAVTVDELVTLLTTAAFANMTFSKETSTNRLKAVAGTGSYLQLYGEGMLLAEFGQGLGTQFIKSDTIQSFNLSSTYKESEQLTVVDSNGKETEIITDSYKKGGTAEVTDTALDWALKALIDGGTYDATAESYDEPDSESEKVYFMVENFYALYSKGSNKEGDLIGYIKETIKSCVGQSGDEAHDRNINTVSYSLTFTNYKDENGSEYGAKGAVKLTVPEYKALDVENV